ncbi:hypothetical protein [Pseudolactococcus laudensis]|uniref:hypothetical protein n=1 Tax=Pseudolactococcus laudensis TaxID=1494461 RepID=UPI002FCBE3E4
MKVTIEELFTNDEFENIIDKKWVKQFQKNGKLQTDTKKAIITKLSKYYASAEYVRGTKKAKAGFEIGDKLSVEMSNADMIINNIKKSNIAKYKLTAFQLFKNYSAKLKSEGVTTKTMTRLKWLESAGITSDIKDLWAVDAHEIKDRNSPVFIKYYKNDLATYLKAVFTYCVSQLNIKNQELYYCDCAFDEDVDADENGVKKRILTEDEIDKYKAKRNELKEKYEVKNFYNAPREFSKELSDYVLKVLKSNNLWVEVELDFSSVNDEIVDVDEVELRKEFMSEFKQHRQSLYVKREFKKDNTWRLESLLATRASVKVPHRQYEERNYFKFMTELDEVIGFGKADWSEYNETKEQYEKHVIEIKQLFIA